MFVQPVLDIGNGGFKAAILDWAGEAGIFDDINKGLGAAHLYEGQIFFPGSFVVMHRQAPELQRDHLSEAVIDIVEWALVNVQLSLPACTAVIEVYFGVVQVWAIQFFQSVPFFVALYWSPFRMTVYTFLEVVNLTAVWDEGQSAFSMEELIFVSVLFKEQMMPWSGQKLH